MSRTSRRHSTEPPRTDRIRLQPYGTPAYWQMLQELYQAGIRAQAMGRITMPLAAQYGWRGPVDLAACILQLVDSHGPDHWRNRFGVVELERAISVERRRQLVFDGVVKSVHTGARLVAAESPDEAFQEYAQLGDVLLAQTETAAPYVQRALGCRPAAGEPEFNLARAELSRIPQVRDIESPVCLALPAWIASMYRREPGH